MFALSLLAELGKNPALVNAWQRVAKLPEERLGKILDLYQALPSQQVSSAVASGFLKNLTDNPSFLEWFLRLGERLSDRPLERFFENLIVHEMAEGQRIRRDFLAREGFEAPVTIVLNPTMACNLQCTGCYSYKMPRKGMDYALCRKVLTEARAMGTYFITVSGGEPFIYKHFFRMVEEFSDLQFMTYTNSTLIDEEIADRIAAAGNVMPAISVEGFGEETDQRRGPGVHDKVLRAMSLLRERGVLFGFSATPTRHNTEVIASDEFLDYYLDKGVLFGWMFQYIPIGKDPDLGLMATPAQRELVRAKTKEWQVSKPLFIGDFWNDGACVGGCLSATRYCYITPEGKVQPCTFVQYHTHDLREHSLLEVFRSRFFRAIRSRQPYDRNLLRTCQIIDHPEVLREVIAECGATPSYDGAETIVEDPTVRAHLDRYAEEWGRIADQVWRGPEYQDGDSVLVPFLGRINANQHYYRLRVDPEERRRAESVAGLPPEPATTALPGARTRPPR
jgi:MoaA/NifB/PqqE/SkfB family radical SAM enzyme